MFPASPSAASIGRAFRGQVSLKSANQAISAFFASADLVFLLNLPFDRCAASSPSHSFVYAIETTAWRHPELGLICDLLKDFDQVAHSGLLELHALFGAIHFDHVAGFGNR